MIARSGPLWRWARGFDASELEARLRELDALSSTGPSSGADAAQGDWHHYYSEAVIARERPGHPEPNGAFERAKRSVAGYDFSDPDIVRGYFDASGPLLGRPMLLELKVMGLHFLCGVAVRAVRDETLSERSVYGYRYDTLAGHPEAGAEWFLLHKEHATGDVLFRIQATWRAGELPNWWTRLGFKTLSRPYQRAWHRSAYLRLRTILGSDTLPPLPRQLLRPFLASSVASDEAVQVTPSHIVEHEG